MAAYEMTSDKIFEPMGPMDRVINSCLNTGFTETTTETTFGRTFVKKWPELGVRVDIKAASVFEGSLQYVEIMAGGVGGHSLAATKFTYGSSVTREMTLADTGYVNRYITMLREMIGEKFEEDVYIGTKPVYDVSTDQDTGEQQ